MAVQIMVRDVVDAQLSSGLLNARLRLSLVGFLRSALGTRLIEEKKAA